MDKCKKHPRYRGKSAPKYDCKECLEIYIKENSKPRKKLPPPTRAIASKKEYNRKKEKKISDE